MTGSNRTLNPQYKEDIACNGTINYGLLQRTILDAASREELKDEAVKGEQLLAQEVDEEELRTALWNPPAIPQRVCNTSSTIRKASTAKAKGRKPGDRNPARDPVGQEYATAG